MVYRYILHNEEIREASEKLLSPGQVGLLAGWGVFTTLRVADGVLFAWERHWARMRRDAALFHVPFPEDSELVRRNLHRLIEANGSDNCTVRLVVVRNGGGMWEGPGNSNGSDLVALMAASKEWGEAVRLCYAAQARHSACGFAGTKILSWAMNLTWLEEAQSRGYDEVILLNERGEVSECTSANIFIANGHRVSTPPLSSGCLPGITREVLLSEVHVPDFSVEERTLMPADLGSADEVFITSTTRDLLPVSQIEGRPVRNAGSARAALQGSFAEYLRQYVARHKQQAASRE